jgi:hypothetical protein
MLKLTASNGQWLWVRPDAIKAFRVPVPAESAGDKEANTVIFVTDLGWHVRNPPEEIAKALEKL